MFSNLKQLTDLMKNAGALREKAQQLKEELGRKNVIGEAGGGAVRVTMSGKGLVSRVELDANLLLGIAGDDKAVVEDLIAAAVNDAHDRVQRLIADTMREMTGGMNLTGLEGLID